MASSWRVIAWLVAVLWSMGSAPRISAYHDDARDHARVDAQEDVGVLPTRRTEHVELSAEADDAHDELGNDVAKAHLHGERLGAEARLELNARHEHRTPTRSSLGSGSPRGPPITA